MYYGLSECDGEVSIMRRTWPTGGAVAPWNAAKLRTNSCMLLSSPIISSLACNWHLLMLVLYNAVRAKSKT